MPLILMIDDDLDLLTLTKNSLEEKGYTVKTYSNWEDAEKYLHKNEPDLIMLDVFMHTHDGLNICNKLKSSGFTRHIPILILSGFSQLSNSATEEFGANGFLAKPFEIKALLKKIHTILSRKK
ncbi:MAG: response regulator [Chitinophagaceae bacterium]|nr:response regulator [Chitinophagaceae bacterium]MCZ2396026.1 response regulator [Chitinophagales bacterium]